MHEVIQPGETLGVLGGGQLGRMFAIAAKQMGYRVHIYCPGEDPPAAQVADEHTNASYEDLDAIAAFAKRVSVITFEFENVPSSVTEAAERHAPVRPAGSVLHTTQNRDREKSFLRDAGLPVTPFAAVASEAELADAIDALGIPAVLKTAAWGYDGKGQAVIRTREQAADKWALLGSQPCVLEKMIDFDCELSVVAARGIDGHVELYGPMRNEHANHILDITSCPAGLPKAVVDDAIDIARQAMDKLEVIGVLCVEFFLTRDNTLLINELAPRPHNSGHLTIDAHATSQYEQQVRAICGLPLGSAKQRQPAAMANLLGDLWQSGPPRWEAACGMDGVKLHLYGKTQPNVGRKMGHLSALGDTTELAIAKAQQARQMLTPQPLST